MTCSNTPHATIASRPMSNPSTKGFGRFCRLSPYPSRVKIGRRLGIERGAARVVNFFCAGGARPKVCGRCPRNRWIGGASQPKSLIVEQYHPINRRLFSIDLSPKSTISPLSSIAPLSPHQPPSFSLSLCKQEEEREESPTSRGRGDPSFRPAAYFFIHQFDFAFRATDGLWWNENPCGTRISGVIHQYPPIHHRSPCSPLERTIQ